MDLIDGMHTAVMRFLDMNDDDQVVEIARAEEATAALPATTPPAVKHYYEATVGMMKTLHDLRPPVREVAARSLRAALHERDHR